MSKSHEQYSLFVADHFNHAADDIIDFALQCAPEGLTEEQFHGEIDDLTDGLHEVIGEGIPLPIAAAAVAQLAQHIAISMRVAITGEPYVCDDCDHDKPKNPEHLH